MTDLERRRLDEDDAEFDLLQDTELFINELELRKKQWASVVQKCRRLSVRHDAASELLDWLESIADITAREVALEHVRERLCEQWKKKAHENLLKLEADLRDSCATRGWRVDGQWPDLYVERGIRVAINESKRSATIGNVRPKHSTVPAILGALESQVKDLIPQAATPETFVSELSRAYDLVSNGKDGQLAIFDVYAAFVMVSQSSRFRRDARADYFSSVTIDQFRARLSWALEAEIASDADGRELRLYPPIDVKDAIFIYIPAEERFGYVGRIEFVHAGDS